jgi:hypothetical protein
MNNFICLLLFCIVALSIAGKAAKGKESVDDVDTLLNDPQFAQKLGLNGQELNDEYYDTFIEQLAKTGKGKDDSAEDGINFAELGLHSLGKAYSNPELLKEALDELQNPETIEQVRALMSDPQFQKDMKNILGSPKYKAAMARVKSDLEVRFEYITNDYHFLRYCLI